ncbi:hypothetical protein STA3757_42290 [Stanieria sp. NIES-3757]|nr:hypothetical protein STA3757_42290 [Stanieria sp. NIES-3757]
MQSLDIKTTINAWSYLGNKIFVPHTEEEYEKLVVVLDSLIDEVGEEESHPLASLMEIMGILIENYEKDHISELL